MSIINDLTQAATTAEPGVECEQVAIALVDAKFHAASTTTPWELGEYLDRIAAVHAAFETEAA